MKIDHEFFHVFSSFIIAGVIAQKMKFLSRLSLENKVKNSLNPEAGATRNLGSFVDKIVDLKGGLLTYRLLGDKQR